MAETLPATGLYIENPYCFTVAAKDEVGNVGPAGMAMATATFNRRCCSLLALRPETASVTTSMPRQT